MDTQGKQYIKVSMKVDDGNGQMKTETLWVSPITHNTAKLESVPFFSKNMSYGDVVRFSRKKIITKVIERNNRTAILKFDYDPTHDPEETQLKTITNSIRNVLRDHAIEHTEVVSPYIAVTVPLKTTPEDLGVLLDEVNMRLGEPLIESAHFSG